MSGWRKWGRDWLLAAAIALVTGWVFRSVNGAAFLRWDDDVNIQDNPHLRALTGENLRWMFTDLSYMRRYVPLGWLRWALEYRWFGPGPRAFHRENLGLHCLDAGLLFLLLLKFLRMLPAFAGGMAPRAARLAAACGALLWALHPLRVEAVAWASGLYSQAVFFLLLSFGAYLRGATLEMAAKARRLYLAGSVLAFGLSAATYPLGLSYPAVLVVVDLCVLRRRGNLWLEKIPFFAVAIAISAATLWARYAAAGIWQPPPTLAAFGWLPRLMQAAYLWAYYAWKPFLPFGLSPVYTTLVWLDPRAAKFGASLAAVLGVTAVLVWQRPRWPLTLALWICHLLLLFPLLGLTEHPYYPNDRYSYLAAIPVSFGIAVGLSRLRSRLSARALAWAVACLAIVACGRASADQVRIWRDTESLFGAMVARLGSDPYRADILMRWAAYLDAAGRHSEAVSRYEEVLRIVPDAAEAHFRLAADFTASGRTADALVHSEAAVRLGPGDPEAENQLGFALRGAGRFTEAIEHYRAAIRLRPDFAEAHNNLGAVLGNLGRMTEAAREFATAVRLKPDYSEARRNLELAGAALRRRPTP